VSRLRGGIRVGKKTVNKKVGLPRPFDENPGLSGQRSLRSRHQLKQTMGQTSRPIDAVDGGEKQLWTEGPDFRSLPRSNNGRRDWEKNRRKDKSCRSSSEIAE